jgi:integrase/recombinase XerD
VKAMRVENARYRELINGFTDWLETLNYAESTVYGWPRYVSEFFFYLEQKDSPAIEAITGQIVSDYFLYLSRRKKQNLPGALSLNSLRNRLTALRGFSRYLRETLQGNLDIPVQLPVYRKLDYVILTKKEIKALYDATGETLLGLRDKAMLGIYYGCGLRRNEGAALNLEDVQLEKEQVFVRKGKGCKERYVPIATAIKPDFENYINYTRPLLTKLNPEETAFFVSLRGKRTLDSNLYERLQRLKEKAGIIKPVGLHTLRHSIATHLLRSGMSLEFVSHFLGHSSLESTQIYTHIANQ